MAAIDGEAAVVCGIDGSQNAIRAVRVADGLRRRLGLRLVLAHAATPRDDPFSTPAETELVLHAALALMRQLAHAEALDHIELRCEIGRPLEALPRIAAEERSALLVIGSDGTRPPRSTLAGRIASTAPCPVVVVPAAAPSRQRNPPAILCGIDGGAGADEALRVADILATQLDAQLIVAHVAPLTRNPRAAALPATLLELRRSDVANAEALIAEAAARVPLHATTLTWAYFGTPGGALADLALEEAPDLVVIGSRARSTSGPDTLGTVTAELLASSSTPVVVVPRGVSWGGCNGTARQ